MKYNSNPSLASINNMLLHWGGMFSNIHIKNSNFYDDDDGGDGGDNGRDSDGVEDDDKNDVVDGGDTDLIGMMEGV